MKRREYTVPVKCGHPGCDKSSLYTASTRAEVHKLESRVATWRCVRHAALSEVLSTAEPRKTKDLVAVRVRASDGQSDLPGLFWGGRSAFEHGPGFKAFASDFPEGTILRITAEIVLPEHPTRRRGTCVECPEDETGRKRPDLCENVRRYDHDPMPWNPLPGECR